jgi:UPF0042 nucleotide-binding protein
MSALKPQAHSNIKTLIFLCGLSGAGRSTALDALSDLGFFTNENLPIEVCKSFLEYAESEQQRFSRTVLAPDVASAYKVELFLEFLKILANSSISIQTIFLEASSSTIVKRYGQTRRPHPFFDPNLDLTLEDTIARERQTLFPIREKANLVIDTSNLNLHELRKEISAFAAMLGSKNNNLVRVNLIAFGFKHGIPSDCDLVVDVRFLPNPFFVPALKDKTGLDKEVQQFVLSLPDAQEFTKLYLEQLNFLVRKHADSGKLYLNIGVGCTGGRHRSVVLAEQLGTQLKSSLPEESFSVSLKYRDVNKPQ